MDTNNPPLSFEHKPTVVPGKMRYRLVSSIIDNGILFIFFTPMQFLLIMGGGIFASRTNIDKDSALAVVLFGAFVLTYIIGSFFLMTFYYNWFYKNKSSTPGKMIMQLEVLEKGSGNKFYGLGNCFLREVIGKSLSSTLFIGFIMGILSREKKCLHDIISKTRVVRKIS